MSQLVSFLDSKTPSEIVAISLEFNKVLTTIDTIDSVTISVVSGTDPNVGTMLLNSPVKVGTIVTQLVRNGVDGNMYLITGNVTSGNEKYSLAGYLPIVSYK